MNVALVDKPAKLHVLRARNTWDIEVEYTAPCSLREIEHTIVIGIRIVSNLVGEFQVFTKHDIVRFVLVRHGVVREVEEQRSVERSTLFMEHADLRVIVVKEGIFGLHGISNEFNIANCRVVDRPILEHIWFLIGCCPSPVVEGEWVEGSDVVPAGADVVISVKTEAADVGACERDTHNILHHYVHDGVIYIIQGGLTVSVPL